MFYFSFWYIKWNRNQFEKVKLAALIPTVKLLLSLSLFLLLSDYLVFNATSIEMLERRNKSRNKKKMKKFVLCLKKLMLLNINIWEYSEHIIYSRRMSFSPLNINCFHCSCVYSHFSYINCCIGVLNHMLCNGWFHATRIFNLCLSFRYHRMCAWFINCQTVIQKKKV